MLIRGVNAAVTHEGGCTILDLAELLHLLTRRERLQLIRMLETYNEDEKLDALKAYARASARQRRRRAAYQGDPQARRSPEEQG